MWALPQVLALCHIAVGQQMNLHWLHKVRSASTGTQGGGERLEATAAEEEPGHPSLPQIMVIIVLGANSGLYLLIYPSQPCSISAVIIPFCSWEN